MTNYDWLKFLDIDTFAQFLQHTLFVRDIKTGETKYIGAKTLINACVDIGKWLSETQEFEIVDEASGGKIHHSRLQGGVK